MPVRRGALQGHGRADQRPDLPLPQLPEGDRIAVHARALYPQTALEVEGETGSYPSSATLDRVFCKACGTRLFSWRKNGTAAGVALAAFDDRHAFAPTEHIWVSEKMNWVKIDDGLPQYPKGAPPV
jgi:hypothetical protein